MKYKRAFFTVQVRVSGTFLKRIKGCLRVCLTVCVIGLLLTGTGEQVYARQAQTVQLTLRECIERGLRNNPDIRRTGEDVNLAQAQTDERRSERKPVISLRMSYSRASEVDPFRVTLPLPVMPKPVLTIAPVIVNYSSVSAQFSQPVYTGKRISAGIESADTQQEIARLDEKRTRQSVVYSVTAAYWRLTGALQNREVILQSIEQAKAHLQDVKRMQEQGLAMQYDVLRSETRLAQVEAAEASILKAEQTAQVRLNTLMGESRVLGTAVVPSESPGAPSPEILTLEECIASGFANRPEYTISEHLIHISILSKTIARSGMLPNVYLIGNYEYSNPNRRVQPPRKEWDATWDVGVSLQVTLWDWGKNQSLIEQAAVNRQKAEIERTKIQDTIISEVTESYAAVSEATKRVEAAQRAAAHSEENLRITQTLFKQGMATNTMLLDAEQDWLKSRTDLATAQMDYAVACAALVFAMGSENDRSGNNK